MTVCAIIHKMLLSPDSACQRAAFRAWADLMLCHTEMWSDAPEVGMVAIIVSAMRMLASTQTPPETPPAIAHGS